MTDKPHDALFKGVFQQPENAAAELKHVLSPQHAAAIDWTTLTLEPGSFVDRKLVDKHSDLLFSANARASGERVLVYLLFEHQSTAEPKMALRLLGYMLRIWERFSDEHTAEPLPLIVPAVLAQVPGGWNSPTRFSGLFSSSVGPLAETVLPDFTYAVDDLHHADDADLRRRTAIRQVQLTLWLMRDVRDGARLLQRLVGWSPDLERLARAPGGEDALAPLLTYIARVSPDLQFEKFRAILKRRAPITESMTVTIAERLLAEGEARGLAQGEARGLAQGELRQAASSLFAVLETRGLPLPAELRQRIEACKDLGTLQAWLVRAVTAASADDVFDA